MHFFLCQIFANRYQNMKNRRATAFLKLYNTPDQTAEKRSSYSGPQDSYYHPIMLLQPVGEGEGGAASEDVCGATAV